LIHAHLLTRENETVEKMKTYPKFPNPGDPSRKAYQYFLEEKYNLAATLYAQEISANPTECLNYWYLGLTQLLQGEEVEAQTTWLSVMMEAEPEQVDQWTAELVEVLETEAQRQESLEKENNQFAWAIRQHIRELLPNHIENLLHLLGLSIKLEILSENDSVLANLTEKLKSSSIEDIHDELLQSVWQQVLDFAPAWQSIVDFSEACLAQTSNCSSLATVFTQKVACLLQQDLLPQPILARYAELYLRIQPENLSVLVKLINLYQDTQRYAEGSQLAEQFIERAETVPDRIAARYLFLRGLMKAGGNLQLACISYKEYQELILKLIELNMDLSHDHLTNLISTTSFSSYLYDSPRDTNVFRHQVSSFLQIKIKNHFRNLRFRSDYKNSTNNNNSKVLKIGYISSCLRRHSVGYLSRWIFRKLDSSQFQTYGYSLKRTDDEIQQGIARGVSVFRDLSQDQSIPEIVELIDQDEIDILVDLDSLTSSTGCAVMALKPAPIQVTWLGFDAAELPTVDYFIADPYVLPETAQDYYSETIWRLPQTYIAVDGFEVGVPTLRREDLNIPTDAVVYFSSQTGAKRHPDNVRLQMQILKAVPNSYFLVKGLYTDVESVKRFFEEIAAEEGVKFEQLRFLPDVPSEAVHRANLAIADVVLDTYPYNGTTTTLETLWMGVPVVTRVGEQFASRQGYTLLMNVGVTEGIAWTDEQYVEWGVRLGKDAALRQDVAWKLRMSRHSAPLWSAQKFTRDLEDAYRQMWEMYLKSQ
jgi:predicted O-linked N-acetylglucosamine transferase (SPINDLY family)